MKSFLLSLASFISLIPASAQTAKEWFWPKGTFNKVTYYMPDANSGVPTNATRVMYYIQNGYYDKKAHHPKFTNYEIVDIKLLNNEPGLVDKKTLEFIGNEVKIKRDERQLMGNIKTTNMTPSETIFKLPQKGMTTNWINNGQKYTASWSKIKSLDMNLDAVKVVQYSSQWHSATIQYYVKEYGLVETIITADKSPTIIADKFHQRLFDENLYTDDFSENTTFNFLKTDDIFEGEGISQSYEETKSDFSALEEKQQLSPHGQSATYHNNHKVSSSLGLIQNYQEYVINNKEPNIEGVQTKYDNRDFRVILWNDKLYNKSIYNEKSMKDLGYDYMGVTEDDSNHITYTYRNCQKNLILDVTEWYNIKLSIYISWFSDVVKNSSGRFIGCSTVTY
jgi:hypothetical protein